MPHEGSCSQQVSIASHRFAFVHREHKRVNGFLVNVATAFVVKNESDRGRILNRLTVLVACQLSNCFINVAFVENAESFPEDEHGVVTLAELVVGELANGTPQLFSDQVVDIGLDFLEGISCAYTCALVHYCSISSYLRYPFLLY